ncbi:hypothetical protein D9753_20640 [Streptomyces dangxiongensis]|uniref:Uncharacterized protein n=1 Tax=Streptomyces dangxiongensis TaxID=1442032 RepID=A0A3G2JJY1_9ACTN|nr:hypothetical protein [Streptomyces dangxiongensis]AYN40889.1 hypothetical protein D9753_20640 [Streptomyces dangxiongensis]
MGMKDQFQEKSGRQHEQAEEKPGQARERAGQRGQQERQGRQPQGRQPERGRPGHRDVEDTEKHAEDRFDQDYDA